jgi:hypothetical protein
VNAISLNFVYAAVVTELHQPRHDTASDATTIEPVALAVWATEWVIKNAMNNYVRHIVFINPTACETWIHPAASAQTMRYPMGKCKPDKAYVYIYTNISSLKPTETTVAM